MKMLIQYCLLSIPVILLYVSCFLHPLLATIPVSVNLIQSLHVCDTCVTNKFSTLRVNTFKLKHVLPQFVIVNTKRISLWLYNLKRWINFEHAFCTSICINYVELSGWNGGCEGFFIPHSTYMPPFPPTELHTVYSSSWQPEDHRFYHSRNYYARFPWRDWRRRVTCPFMNYRSCTVVFERYIKIFIQKKIFNLHFYIFYYKFRSINQPYISKIVAFRWEFGEKSVISYLPQVHEGMGIKLFILS